MKSTFKQFRPNSEDGVVEVVQIGITGQTGTNWDTEMVFIWSLIPVSAS